MGWKIYFWFIGLPAVPVYLFQGFSRPWEIIDAVVFAASLLGLYGFVWRKPIATSTFWKIYFFMHVSWNVYYQFFIPIVPKAKEMMGNSLSQPLAALLNLTFFIPLVIALYLYAFNANSWKNKT